MPKSRTRYAVLGALTLGPMSGYDIKRLADESLAHFWAESYGQIYPILKQLAGEGLIRPRGRGARRSEFALTAKGRRSLRTWLVQPPLMPAVRIELLLKLFFARQIPAAETTRLLKEFRTSTRAWVAQLNTIEADLQRTRAQHPDLPYWLMTVRYGMHVSRAAIRWADETLAELRRATSR